MQTITVQVHKHRTSDFKIRLNELTSRFPGIMVVETIDPMKDHSYLDFLPNPPPAYIEYIVQIPFPRYKIGEFTLIGILAVDENGRKGLWTLEEGYFTREIENADFLRCDHCGSRRQRKKLFFFYNEEAKNIIQVGSTCCQDFLGVDVERELNKFWQAIEASFSEYGESGGMRQPNSYDSTWIVPVAIALVEAYGYTSKKSASERGEASTADALTEILSQPRSYEDPSLEKLRKEIFTVARDNAEKFKAEFEIYAEEVTKRHRAKYTDFTFNLVNNLTFTTHGFAAFIASDIISKRAKNSLGPKVTASRILDVPISDKMADLGEFVLTFLREEDGQYGIQYLHIGKKSDGQAVMFRRKNADIKVGETFNLRGKIKKHLADITVVGYPKVW